MRRTLTVWLVCGLVLMPYSLSTAQTAHRDATSSSMNESTTTRADRSESSKEIVRNLYEGILNTGHLELLGQVVSDEYVGPTGQAGPTGFAAPIRAVRVALPDAHWTVDDIVAEGDKVAVRWTLSGTHQGAFNGFAATQSPIRNRGMAMFLIRNDKIVQSWIETDRLGFLQQIGVIPQDLAALRQPADMKDRSGPAE